MLADLVALMPPLIVAGAFLIGVVLFLRRQMGTGHPPVGDEGRPEIPDERRNADPVDPAAPSAQHGKV